MVSLPGLRRHLVGGTNGAERPGVVERDIESAKTPHGRFHERMCNGLVLDITCYRDGRPTGARDVVDEVVQFLLAPGRDDHLGSLSRKKARRRTADAGAGSGDDRHAIHKCIHEWLPPRPPKSSLSPP